MRYFFFKQTLAAVTVASAVCLTSSANAQRAVASTDRCAQVVYRASEIKFIPLHKSLADLSLSISISQKNNLALSDVFGLEGQCSDEVFAVRMNQIEFNDGKIFSNKQDGKFSYAPGIKGLTNLPGPPILVGPPPVDQAKFLTASKVDSGNVDGDIRSLDLGIWKESESYMVAAYTRRKNGASSPTELLRSKYEIKSVTFFPSPDSNSGKITILLITDTGPVVASLNWDHSFISTTLYQAK